MCLIFADLAGDARVVLLGNPEKGANRPDCLLRLGAGEVFRRLDAGRTLPLDQVDQERAVVLAADLKFGRSARVGIEQRRILDSERFGNRMMVSIGEPELLAHVAQQLQALGRFGVAAFQRLGQDRAVGFALLCDGEVWQRLGEHVDLVGRELVDRPPFENVFGMKSHAHQLVAQAARQSFPVVELGVAGQRADQPGNRDKDKQRIE